MGFPRYGFWGDGGDRVLLKAQQCPYNWKGTQRGVETGTGSKKFQTLGFPGNGFWGDGGGCWSLMGMTRCVWKKTKTISFWVRWEIMSHAGGSSNRSEEGRWWASQKIDKVECWELETWFWVMNQRWVLSFGFSMSLSFETWLMNLRYEFWVMFFEFWIRFSPKYLLSIVV